MNLVKKTAEIILKLTFAVGFDFTENTKILAFLLPNLPPSPPPVHIHEAQRWMIEIYLEKCLTLTKNILC